MLIFKFNRPSYSQQLWPNPTLLLPEVPEVPSTAVSAAAEGGIIAATPGPGSVPAARSLALQGVDLPAAPFSVAPKVQRALEEIYEADGDAGVNKIISMFRQHVGSLYLDVDAQHILVSDDGSKPLRCGALVVGPSCGFYFWANGGLLSLSHLPI